MPRRTTQPTPPPRAALTGDLAISDTRRRTGRGQAPQVQYNPDELVGRKGLRVYDEMLVDEQVRACVGLKKAALLGAGWTLDPTDESTAAVALRDLVQADLDALPTGLDDVLWEVLSAMAYGFSLTEQVWAPDGGRLRLVDLRPIAPHHLEFVTDDYGHVTAVQQTSSPDSPFPPEKFLHFLAAPEFGNPYGASDLRAAHRDWFHKKYWVQWFANWGEKLADPPILSKSPKNTPAEKVAAAQQVLDNMQARTVVNVPEPWEVSLLVDSRDPKRVFIEAIDRHDAGIAKALLVPDKLGVAGGEVAGGSYSLGQTQFDVFLLALSLLRRRLQRCVQRQLIDRMVRFAQPGQPAPVFTVQLPNEDDRARLAELWNAAVTSGNQVQTLRDVNHFRELVKFPPITQDELDAEQERKMAQAQAIAGGDQGADSEDGEADDTQATDPDDATAEMSRGGFWRLPTKPELRADMAAQRDALDDGADRLGRALATGALGLVADVKAAASRLLTAGLTPNGVRDLAAKTTTFSALRRAVEDELVRSYNRSVAAAGAELRRARADETMVASLTQRLTATMLDDEDATLARAGLIGSAAERFFRAKSFWVTGILEGDILKAAQAVLFNAIKGDKPDRTVLLELDDALHPYVPQTDRAGRAVNVPARLETIARTNAAEAQNEARYAVFTDPDLAGLVEALQYSAILDDRVRATHAAWDGVVKPAAWWPGPPDRRPPAGFQCRCTLLPVIAGDDMPVTPDAELPRVEFPDPGFR